MSNRTFGIPGDLDSMAALRHGRYRRRTPAEVERRLANLERCVEHGIVPDANGKELEPSETGRCWEAVEVPAELSEKMRDLGEAVAAASERLDAGDTDAALERLEAIEPLVANMAYAADPARRRGDKVSQSAGSGGRGRAAKYQHDYQSMLDETLTQNPRWSTTQARKDVAKHFDVHYKTVERNTTNPRK